MDELRDMMSEMLLRFDRLELQFDALTEKVDHNTTLLEEVLQMQQLTNAKLESLVFEESIGETLYNHSALHSKHVREIRDIKSTLNKNVPTDDIKAIKDEIQLINETIDVHSGLYGEHMTALEVIKMRQAEIDNEFREHVEVVKRFVFEVEKLKARLDD